MIVLDENVIRSQVELLKSWRVHARQIGADVGPLGVKDEQIIPILCKLRRVTFLKRDLGFYDRHLCHRRYCLVCMAVERSDVAFFVRHLLRHPDFNTQAKRMGCVIRLSPHDIRIWRLNAKRAKRVSWPA